MDDLAALAAACSEFRIRLIAVTDDAWHLPTPCSEWDVAALVDHVNRTNLMAELLLHGADAAISVGSGTDPRDGESPLDTFDSSVAAQAAAFAEPGALERMTDHPASQLPGDVLLLIRTLDIAVHAWDLATALGTDSDLDPALMASIWTRVEPLVPLLTASGMFGTPSPDEPADASPQARLLGAVGRSAA